MKGSREKAPWEKLVNKSTKDENESQLTRRVKRENGKKIELNKKRRQ